MPSRPAARQTSDRITDGSAAASCSRSPGRVGQRLEPPEEALLDPAGKRRSRRAARTRPPAPLGQPARQFQQRQRVSVASAMIRSRTRGSSGPVAPRPAAPARHRPRSPSTSSSGSPARSSLGSRAANTSPTGSASSRRATNPSACAEARSSHCSSSITQTSGSSPGRPGQQAQHRQAHQKPVRQPARCSCRTRSAAPRAAVPAGRSERGSNGAHSWCSPANAQFHLRLHAHHVRDPAPHTRCPYRQVLQQHGLAYARFAAHQQGSALPALNRFEQLVQRVALTDSAYQPRRGGRPLGLRAVRRCLGPWAGRLSLGAHTAPWLVQIVGLISPAPAAASTVDVSTAATAIDHSRPVLDDGTGPAGTAPPFPSKA